jgi:ankyrin repeat protein
VVEIGIYIVSNHLDELWPMGDFIETVLQSISWRVLRRVLLVEAPSVQAFSERVFLHAITTQSLHVVEDLLRHKFIEATVISNGLALVSAVRTSNCELVSMILDAGACPNKIAFGNLPLTETRDVHVARLVLEAGADINSFASIIFIGKYMLSHVTALAVATASKNIDLVRYLIEKGADVNLHSGWERKENSTTMLAVESGIIEILQMLLQAGSRPDEVSRTLSRMTPLQKAGTRPNEASKMHYQLMTPLQKAALIGDIEAVRLLIKYGGDVNAPAFGTSGATALQAAVSQGDVEMTKVLLENGAEVNIPSNSDAKFPHSLLTTAVEMNHPELVKIILDAGAEVNISSFGYYGCTPLESAMYLPHGSDICDLLVGRGAQHNTLSNNEYRQVQLRKAVWAEDLVRVKVLLGTGMKIDMSPIEDSPYRESHNIRLLEERSILQDAIITGSAVFQLLFDVIKSYNDDVDFHPLLVEAIRVKNVEIRTTLLDAGANINSTHCHAGKLIGTPLMFAVWKNDFEAVRFLYHKGADVNVVAKGFHLSDFRRASTALQISLWHAEYERASFEMFHFLRHHGATINAPIARKYGLSELASAVTTGDLAIVQELLDAGANVNSPPAEVGGRTALQAAADLYSAKIEMVQLLLQRRADVNALPACRYGITALGAAAKGGLFQVALILLKAGADVNAEFYSYGPSTSLREAASWGRLDMVHLLLKAGADPHLPKDERYVRAAEDARRRGHIAITTILENWKVDEVLECALSTAVPQAEGESLVIELE